MVGSTVRRVATYRESPPRNLHRRRPDGHWGCNRLVHLRDIGPSEGDRQSARGDGAPAGGGRQAKRDRDRAKSDRPSTGGDSDLSTPCEPDRRTRYSHARLVSSACCSKHWSWPCSLRSGSSIHGERADLWRLATRDCPC